MNVGIISDTHDDIATTNLAIDIFEEKNVKAVIHAGDIISPPIITEFKRLTDKGVEFFGILGNNDGEKNGLKDAFKFINGKFLGDVGKIELAGLKFGIYHGMDLRKKEKMIKSGKFDVFIYGHSHTRDPKDNNLNCVGKTIVFNPGNAHREEKLHYLDKPYFQEPTIIIFDTDSKGFKFFNL
jgi:hypothetical protein